MHCNKTTTHGNTVNCKCWYQWHITQMCEVSQQQSGTLPNMQVQVFWAPLLVYYDHENHDFDFGVHGVLGVVGVPTTGVDDEDPTVMASPAECGSSPSFAAATSHSTFPTTLVLVSRCICCSYILTSSSVIPYQSSIQANACLCPRSKISRILWNENSKMSYLLQA